MVPVSFQSTIHLRAMLHTGHHGDAVVRLRRVSVSARRVGGCTNGTKSVRFVSVSAPHACGSVCRRSATRREASLHYARVLSSLAFGPIEGPPIIDKGG